jgi:hypothetical protein
MNDNNSHLRYYIGLSLALNEHSSKKLDMHFEKFLHAYRRNSKRTHGGVRKTSSITPIRQTGGVSLEQVPRVSF